MSSGSSQRAQQQAGSRTGPAQNPNVDADEQMETLSEGKVADAVQRKHGAQAAPGERVVIDSYGSDIDKKKAEQDAARRAVKADRKGGHRRGRFTGPGAE